MKTRFFLALVALAVAIAQPSLATPTPSSSSTGGTATCQDFTITNVATVVAAGNIDLCINFPGAVSSNTAVFYIIGEADAPGTIAGTTTFTWTIAGVSGCTTGTETKTATSGAATSGGSDYFPVTMTSNQCRGTLHVVVSSGATPTTLVTWDLIWNTIVPFGNSDNQERICDESALGATCSQLTMNSDNTNRLCAASAVGASCTTPLINQDSTTRLCAASAIGTACTTPAFSISSWPTLNAALTGTLTVTNAGGQAITVSGTLDNLDRLCAASTLGSSCTTPTITLAGSVTVHNDGTLSVTNSGGQTMTLAGAATIHNDGTLTVTNAGGQTITFGGPLTVHQDPICTVSMPCYSNESSTTVVDIGNLNNTQSIKVMSSPGFFELFGPTIFVLALLVIIPTARIWLVPVAVAFGGLVGIMAFTQPVAILVVMQAASGFALMAFSLYWLGLRFREFNPKERKWFQ